MPFSAGDFDVRSREFMTSAPHYAVEAYVVFESIGPCNVVVVLVLHPRRQPAGLIHLARDCLEPRAHLKVRGCRGTVDCKREAQIGWVRAELCECLSVYHGWICDHLPARRRPAAGQRAFKFLRNLPGGVPPNVIVRVVAQLAARRLSARADDKIFM